MAHFLERISGSGTRAGRVDFEYWDLDRKTEEKEEGLVGARTLENKEEYDFTADMMRKKREKKRIETS